MNKTLLMMGCIVVFLTASIAVNAQILSPVAHLEGTIDPDTKAFFVGRTSFSGDFQGFPIDYLDSNSLFEEINAFPLFGSNIFEDIGSVTIFDIETIDNQSLEAILNLSTHIGIRFTGIVDVDFRIVNSIHQRIIPVFEYACIIDIKRAAKFFDQLFAGNIFHIKSVYHSICHYDLPVYQDI